MGLRRALLLASLWRARTDEDLSWGSLEQQADDDFVPTLSASNVTAYLMMPYAHCVDCAEGTGSWCAGATALYEAAVEPAETICVGHTLGGSPPLPDEAPETLSARAPSTRKMLGSLTHSASMRLLGTPPEDDGELEVYHDYPTDLVGRYIVIPSYILIFFIFTYHEGTLVQPILENRS